MIKCMRDFSAKINLQTSIQRNEGKPEENGRLVRHSQVCLPTSLYRFSNSPIKTTTGSGSLWKLKS